MFWNKFIPVAAGLTCSQAMSTGSLLNNSADSEIKLNYTTYVGTALPSRLMEQRKAEPS